MLKQDKSMQGYLLIWGLVFLFLTSWGINQTIGAQSVEISKGGELLIPYYSKPAHMNPAIQSGAETGVPGSQLFSSLLRIDRNWEYHPYLAKAWKVAEDGMSVVFNLRENSTFHDGKPITSKDVAFSILSVKKYHPFSTMLAAVKDIETPDPLTAIVKLTQPHPALLLATASPMVPIIPEHIYGDGQDLKTHPANWKVIGSGPFKLASVDDEKIVLERYENFFLPGKPYLDRVIIKFMNPKVEKVAFEVDDINFKGLSSDIAMNKEYDEDKKFIVDYGGYAGVGPIMWLAFNLQKPPFDDLRVRQALAYAIDRDFLIKSIFGDMDLEATGPICPGTPFYTDKVEQYDVDIEKANKLLDEAGYPRKANGIRFSTTIHPILATSLTSRKIATFLRTDLLKKIGVNIKVIKSDSFPNWAKSVSNGEFSLAIDIVFNWGDPVIGVHRTYSSTNIRKGVIWSNTQGYKNTEVDELMKQAGVEMNFEKRKEIYEKFQRIISKELPVYWLTKLPYATIHHHKFEGLDNSIWGAMFPYDEVHWKEQSGKK